MRTISEAEFRRAPNEVLEAARREAVVIRREDQELAVVIPADQFEELRRLVADEFDRFCDATAAEARANGMSEEDLAGLLADVS